ncbi:hypothetical protein, partial [Rhodoferax sp.]|uniref:hypothetical protein n=1 Tax=Rhodoferax sp. TaxID=50421 RepID=UPI002634B886
MHTTMQTATQTPAPYAAHAAHAACITAAKAQPQPRRGKGRPVGVVAKGIRVKAWRTMRALSQTSPWFTLGDLLDIIATGREKNAPSNLLKYLSVLERHGILERRPARDHSAKPMGPGVVVWRIAQDLGWYAPVWRQAQKLLWNPN